MARKLSFKPGNRVFSGTTEYEVLGPASLTTVQVRDVIDGEVRILSRDELSSISADAEKTPTVPFECLSEEEQELVLRRFNIIKPAIQNDLTRKDIDEIAKANGLHYTSIYRMIKRYRETMSLVSLLPRTSSRGGRGKPRIRAAVDDLITKHFEEILKKNEVDITKLTVKSFQQELKAKCKAIGLKPPAWGTIDDRLTKFIQEKKLAAKRKTKGGRHRTMAGGMFPDANWPLDWVQIDHTPLDIIIVDEENRQPIGKPHLSLAIDGYSRVILGFILSLDPPSIFSVGRLIAHCILPKDQFLEQIGVKAEWDVFGVMGAIHLDNAGEFRAEDFIPFEEEYLVEFRWRPVATPEYGGYIERLAKTLNDIVHQEPGSTMGDIVRRAGYDAEGHACYTLDEIEKWLTILITKVYHVQEHSGLEKREGRGISPLEKFRIGIIGDGKNPGMGIPDIVEDQERLKLFLLPSFKRTVQREGIELEKIQYFHDVLRTMYGKKGKDGKPKKYLIKRDPRRISPVFIFDPDLTDFFAIPYRDLTRPPMSLWELNAAKKRCTEGGIDDPSEQQIFDAYKEMREIRNESVAKTKKARRQREAEKRREKVPPAFTLKTDNLTYSEPKDVANGSTANVESFYDDKTLLDGVVVSKTQRER